jgi:hypothetical protein
MNRIAWLLAVALLAATAAIAEDKSMPSAEAVERLAQARERLSLTDEQVEQIKPVMEESFAERNAILASYGIDLDNPGGSGRPSFRQARAMRGEMEAVRSDTLAKLDGILSQEQLEEFKLMQEEQRAEMRERMKARASAQ